MVEEFILEPAEEPPPIAELSGLHPFFDIDLVRWFFSHMAIHGNVKFFAHFES